MAATDLVTEAHIDSLATNIASAIKARDTKVGSLASLTTTDKASIVSAINELFAAIGASGAAINDTVTNGTNTWSGNKITADIASAINALLDGAPDALNTLNELAVQVNDNTSFAATITTALANRLRVDAAQTLTAPQQAQALANLGLTRSTVDFAAAFTAAL